MSQREEVTFAVLRDIRAIFHNIMTALEMLPSPVRAKLQDHIDANKQFLARIEKNLTELVKLNGNT
jgi:hypothetical protein